jgi:hypothetical protein
LSLTNDLADLHELCRQFKAQNIGIDTLQELNIDMSQAYIYQRVKAVFDEHFDKQCTMICSTTHMCSATNWKPGSTLLVILPTWTPYIVARQRNYLGRWCSVTLKVQDQRQLVFYSFYNCCKTKIEQAEIHTIFAQQWHVLRARGDRAPDPRLQAVTDLADELAVHKQHSRSICIMGDYNEDIGTDPALMAAVYSSNDLVNVMNVLHPDDYSIPSYARSSNRLDYALVSHNLVPYIAGAGLNHYHEFYPSDHRPIFIGLDSRLFGPLPPISSHRFRYVHSNSKMVGLFVNLAHRHLHDTSTFPRIQALMSPNSTTSPDKISKLANSIDDQITRALLLAEKRC